MIEAPKERCSTGLGFLTITPRRLDMAFRFTILPHPMTTAECLFQLHLVRRYYCRKVIIVWDNLSAHHAAAVMDEEHPEWFDFFFFPTYSPELNPVEPCWHHQKNVEMGNVTAMSKDEMERNLFGSAQKISDDKRLLASFFKHAGLKL